MTNGLKASVTTKTSQVDNTMGADERASNISIEEALHTFFANRFTEAYRRENYPELVEADKEFEELIGGVDGENDISDAHIRCITLEKHLSYKAGFLDALTFMNPERMKAILESWKG